LTGASAHSRPPEAENWPPTRPDGEPPWGIEPQTYALRASPVFDGGGWSVSSSAEVCRAVYVRQRLVMGGRGHVRGKRAPTDLYQAVEFIGFAWGEDDDALRILDQAG
jgi:hypothetical protein